MKINTKQAITDLAGKEIKSPDGVFAIGTALSNILIEAQEGGKMKLFILAQKLFNDKEVEVDEADLGIIRKAVENTKQYNNLVTGQLLQMLDKKDK